MAKKYTNATREWVNVIFWGGLFAILFRSFLLEPFNIPSGSMIPTLQVGDHIFVKKWSYGYSRNSFPFGSWNMWDGRFLASEPDVGDVIVFRKPNDTVDYVKRLVGKPGDTVQYISGRLHINGKQIERINPRPYVIANLPKSLRRVGYQNVDNNTGKVLSIKGDKMWVDNSPATFNYTIEYKSDRLCEQSPYECKVLAGIEWTEILPGGKQHSIIELTDAGEYDDTATYTVPEDHYFMMGDDRDLSLDSRSPGVGYVPRDNLLGRVWFVWYSHNYYSPMLAIWNWGDKMRWNRFGLGIK